jgi:hypothetical protein
MSTKWRLCKVVVELFIGVGALCAPAGAEVKLLQHTAGYTEGANEDYRVNWDGIVPSITILQPSISALMPYSFEAYDDSTNLPAEIGSITADAALEGDVYLEVVPTEDRLYGASDIGQLNFDVQGVTCTVYDVNVEDSLGATGATYVSNVAGLVYAREVLSDVDVTGDVLNDPQAQPPAIGQVVFVHPNGYTLHVYGDAPGYINFGYCVGCEVNGTAQVDGSAQYVHVTGDFTGLVDIGVDLTGELSVSGDAGVALHTLFLIHGDVTEDGWISIGEGAGRVTAGTIEVLGDMLGTPRVPALTIADLFNGQIVIHGTLSRTIALAGEIGEDAARPAISVGEDMPGQIHLFKSLAGTPGQVETLIDIDGNIVLATGAITVDWDGDDPAENWNPSARITVGTNPTHNYTANDDGAHIYDVSCWRGDMNNDLTVNNFDITPFTTGLAHQEEGGDYDTGYPGLWGSLQFHGDVNGDGYFNNFDITPFIKRINDPDGFCDDYPDCGCPGDSFAREEGSGDEPALDPAVVAGELEGYLDPELMPFLITVAEDIIANSSDDAEVALWTHVLAELE